MTTKPVEPDPEDFEAIELAYGRPKLDATDEELADHYRLAVIRKTARLAGIKLDDPTNEVVFKDPD
jgi:hypothetical protein